MTVEPILDDIQVGQIGLLLTQFNLRMGHHMAVLIHDNGEQILAVAGQFTHPRGEAGQIDLRYQQLRIHRQRHRDGHRPRGDGEIGARPDRLAQLAGHAHIGVMAQLQTEVAAAKRALGGG